MKVCPACNESFGDELNFCDIDGTRLAREGSAQDRNKWWSFLGAGLLVGAVVISAASIFFLPKAHVSTPAFRSEPLATPAPAKPAAPESTATVAASAASAEPDTGSADAEIPEPKKRDKLTSSGNFHGAAPNPKAASLAEEASKEPGDAKGNDPSAKRPEAPLPAKTVSEPRVDAPVRPAPNPPEAKKDTKTSPAARRGEKDSDKKKAGDKDNKKGGFLRVFKKIFGKD